MGVTVNVNKISLCHKASGGVVTATIPDVCKTPSPGGPVPIPYPNISFANQLAKGSKKVKVDGGNMAAIKGSEFSTSVGDEPGTVGGVKSGVNKGKATWISYSFDVKIEGKNACRLTDKMLMNKGNTVSMGGYIQPPVSPDDIIYKLCEMACECKNPPPGKNRQQCMADKIKKEFYDGRYPSDNCPVWQEVSMENTANGWQVILNAGGTGNVPTSNPITPGGGIRPDCVLVDNGAPTRVVEVKFPGDRLNANQSLDAGSPYNEAARDIGADDYDVMDVESTCAFCWDPPPPGDPVTADDGLTTGEKVGIGASIVAGIGVVACIIAEPCGAAALAALGLTGGAVLVTQ